MRKIASVTAVAVLLGLGALAPPSASGQQSLPISSTDENASQDWILPNAQVGTLDRLSDKELALFRSDELKHIEVDPRSGDIISVTPMTWDELERERQAVDTLVDANDFGPASYYVNCPLSTQPCWHGHPPGVNYRFMVGVTNGQFYHRANFWTGNYYAGLCWYYPMELQPFCMQERNGTNAWISIGVAPVMGIRADVSTTRV